MSFLYSFYLLQDSNSSAFCPIKAPRILFFNPFGGSLVTFTPFYNTETGNLSLGIEVSHILNSELGSLTIFSKIESKVGMNEGAKWQFCRTTQV